MLRDVLRHAAQWGIDPSRTTVLGESCGALISALTATRARAAGLELTAQVLVNPVVDVAGTVLSEYPEAQHAFLTSPGVEPQAGAAQAEILTFLRAARAT